MRITADFFTLKKTRVTFILSILVFCIHNSAISNYNTSGGFGTFLVTANEAIQALARVAVPLFFVISGALFYRDYEWKLTVKKYKSRLNTLVIPYLVWNAVWTVFSLICTYTFIKSYFIGRQPFVMSVKNVVDGLLLYKAYGPFWFIFYLIIFTALCPVIYFIIKNKVTGIAFLAVVCVITMLGKAYSISFFNELRSLAFYLVGALVGRYGFDWFKSESKTAYRWLSLPVGVGCVAYMYLIETGQITGVFSVPVLLVLCLCFWTFADFFVTGGCYGFENMSFLVFAMHLNVGGILIKVLYIVLPKSVYFAPVNYVLCMVLTVVFIIIFDYVLKRWLPKIRPVFTGLR